MNIDSKLRCEKHPDSEFVHLSQYDLMCRACLSEALANFQPKKVEIQHHEYEMEIIKMNNDLQVKSYVAGFLFNTDKTTVALIRKNKPEWQRGKLNGIGGKIEPLETPYAAMVREFTEEAGLNITSWRRFCVLKGFDWIVHFFVAFVEDRIFKNLKSMTDEEICRRDVFSLLYMSRHNQENLIPNLYWLLPMAMDRDNLEAEVSERLEIFNVLDTKKT